MARPYESSVELTDLGPDPMGLLLRLEERAIELGDDGWRSICDIRDEGGSYQCASIAEALLDEWRRRWGAPD